ncbi:hypothetical protein L4D77_05115 [Photobacterium frigidiphilum]|uniref:hypothetical protein n=1 Tax=Photobacterium frigidiphilum TaxID=264736 RepID=UPI003D0AE4CA
MKSLFIATAILAIFLGSIGNTYAAKTRLNMLKEFAILECRSIIPINQQPPSFKVVNISRTPGIPVIQFEQNPINCADAVIIITKQGFPIIETTIFDSTGTIVVITFGK